MVCFESKMFFLMVGESRVNCCHTLLLEEEEALIPRQTVAEEVNDMIVLLGLVDGRGQNHNEDA